MQVVVEQIFRWMARLGSLASILILGLFLFGGQEEQSFTSSSESLGFAFFPVGIVLGFVIAWKWELIGGVTTLLSLAGFYIWHIAGSGNVATGPWFLVFSSPAVFFLVAWRLRQKVNGNDA